MFRQRLGLFSIPPAGVGGSGDFEFQNSIIVDDVVIKIIII